MVSVSLDRLVHRSADIARLSAFLHDSKVTSVVSEAGTLRMRLLRIGYEHHYLLSDGLWGFLRRWMYPWVECELTITRAERITVIRDDDDFDDVLSLRLLDRALIIGRALTEIDVRLTDETMLHLADTGAPPDPEKGMVIVSRKPLDLSYIEPLLSMTVPHD